MTDIEPMETHATGAADAASPKGSRPWLRPLLLAVGVVALLVTAKLLGLDDRLGELREWILGLGAWGPAVFVLIYAAAVLAAVPASLLTVAAGAMFGSLLGVAVVSVASTLGAALAFLLARFVARDSITRWLGDRPRFAALERMTREHGAIVVAITRLVPIFPFTLLNFGFGLTAVPFRTYLWWSWLCMLPGTVLYVVGADAVTRGLAEGRVPWPLVGIVAVVGAGLALLVHHLRRTMAARRGPEPPEEDAEDAHAT